jgi:hypothetical protein
MHPDAQASQQAAFKVYTCRLLRLSQAKRFSWYLVLASRSPSVPDRRPERFLGVCREQDVLVLQFGRTTNVREDA